MVKKADDEPMSQRSMDKFLRRFERSLRPDDAKAAGRDLVRIPIRKYRRLATVLVGSGCDFTLPWYRKILV